MTQPSPSSPPGYAILISALTRIANSAKFAPGEVVAVIAREAEAALTEAEHADLSAQYERDNHV